MSRVRERGPREATASRRSFGPLRGRQPDFERVRRDRIGNAVCPLDEDRRLTCVAKLEVPRPVELFFGLQAKEVDVHQREAPLVAVDEGKRWTGHLVRRHPGSLGHATHKFRLPRAELAEERDEVPRLQQLSQRRSQRPCLLRRAREEEQLQRFHRAQTEVSPESRSEAMRPKSPRHSCSKSPASPCA